MKFKYEKQITLSVSTSFIKFKYGKKEHISVSLSKTT
jgi:hypothetical protein